MRTSQDVVLTLWCRLTGRDAAELGTEERSAFFARPQVKELSGLPYAQLLEAAIAAADRGSLPLDHWLGTAVSHN